MKHTTKKLSDTTVQSTITLDAADLTTAKKAALQHLAPSVKVAGFRPGKVPAHIAEKNIDPNQLANEVAEHAINIALNDVAVAEDLRVLDRPKIDLKDFKPYDSMEFEATIEVLPEIKLGDYKKLKVKKETAKVDQKEIDEVLERMQQQFAEKKEVKRIVKDGDEVTIDFVGKKDDVAFEGGTAKDYGLTIGSNTFIPGFETEIIGHKPGETFDIPLTFPEDYHAENLKGAKVVFTVTLNKVEEVSLPKVDDALAKKVGPFKNVAELNDDIKKEIAAQKDNQALEQYKDDMVAALVAASKVPVPQILIDDQVKSIEQDAMQNLMYKGLSADQYMAQMGYKDHDEWHEKEFKVAAERRVQAGLVLAELSKAEKIEVTKDELDARHDAMLQQYPNMKEQLDSPESRRDLANRLLTEKTVERLIELNS